MLAPGGRLLFIEHMRSDEPGLFTVAELERDMLRKAPPIARPLLIEAATTAGA